MDAVTYELAPAIRGRDDRVAVYWSVAVRFAAHPTRPGRLEQIDAGEVERVRQLLAVQRIQRATEAALAS